MPPLVMAGPPNSLYPRYVQTVTGGELVPSRNGETFEIRNPVLEFEHPDFPFLFSHGRMINLAFAMAEVLWILSGRNQVKLVDYFNSNIKNYSDDGVEFNAAYGKRMRAFGYRATHASPMIDQLTDVILCLKDDRGGPNTRHAAMIYRDPFLDESGVETKDRACNIASMFLVRQHKLYMTQILRSQDAIWGLPYNLVQWSHVMRYIAAVTGKEIGTMTFQIQSGHLYTKHEREALNVEKWDPFEPYYNYKVFPHFNNQMDTSEPIILCQLLEEMMFSEHPNSTIENIVQPFWVPYFNIFYAYRAFKENNDEVALDWIIDYIPWPYNVLLAKNFFTWRWHKPGFDDKIQKTSLAFGMDQTPKRWFLSEVPKISYIHNKPVIEGKPL